MAEIYTNSWFVDCPNATYGTNAFKYRIRVNENSTDITTNNHNITVYFDIIGVRSYYHDLAPTVNNFDITTNGSPASVNANSNISGAKSTNYSNWTAVGSWTGNIIGNNDGTLTLSVSIKYGISGVDFAPKETTVSTGTIYATTLPRASDLSLGSSSITISSTSGSLSYSITAKSNSFYNRLVWSVAGSADTVVEKNSGSSTGSISYSDIINKMPSASSGKLLAVVKTYSDSGYSNLIGTSSEASCDITLNTSQSVFKPTVTLGNIAINTTPASTYISVAVAGYSTLKATFNSSAGSGSTIDAVYFTSSNGSLNISSSTAASGTVTSKTLPTSSSDYTFTLNAYAIDKRGSVSNTVTKTYTVKGYTPPALTLKAYRVAANVSASPYPQDNAGGYVWVSFTNTVSLTSSGNAVTSATCKYKRSTDSSWTTLSTNPTGTNASSNPNPTLATTSSMTVTYTVQDRISSNEVTINVSTARYAFDLYDDKSNVGVGLGTMAEAGKVKIGGLPLDDTSGRVVIGVSTQSTLPSSSIGVHDCRNVTIPAAGLNRGANFYFIGSSDTNNTRPATTESWWSLLHVKGWDDSGTGSGYTAWELAGAASNNSTSRNRPLYVRGGNKTDGWASWRQIYDSGNKSDLINLIYPVGSIYMSVNSTSPATLFGGTWVQIQDTFLLASGTTYTAGGTGGSNTATLQQTNLPHLTGHLEWHGVANGTHVYAADGVFSASTTISSKYKPGTPNATGYNSKDVKYDNGGASTPFSIMPPYLAVYVWKRTA